MQKITNENAWQELIKLHKEFRELEKENPHKLFPNDRLHFLNEGQFTFCGTSEKGYSIIFGMSWDSPNAEENIANKAFNLDFNRQDYNYGKQFSDDALVAINELMDYCKENGIIKKDGTRGRIGQKRYVNDFQRAVEAFPKAKALVHPYFKVSILQDGMGIKYSEYGENNESIKIEITTDESKSYTLELYPNAVCYIKDNQSSDNSFCYIDRLSKNKELQKVFNDFCKRLDKKYDRVFGKGSLSNAESQALLRKTRVLGLQD